MDKLVALCMLFYFVATTDPVCPHRKPVLCGRDHRTGNNICKKDILECDAFPGCNDPNAPFLCPNGECAIDYFECKVKYLVCDDPK